MRVRSQVNGNACAQSGWASAATGQRQIRPGAPRLLAEARQPEAGQPAADDNNTLQRAHLQMAKLQKARSKTSALSANLSKLGVIIKSWP